MTIPLSRVAPYSAPDGGIYRPTADADRPFFQRGEQTTPGPFDYRPTPLMRAPVAASPAHVRSRGGRRSTPAQPAPYASTPSPYANPGLWDTFGLAGIVFLGVAKVSGEPGVKLDVAKAAGVDGGTVRDKGYELAKIKIKLLLWDEEGWVSWDGLLPAIDPRRQLGRRTPVDASHPALAQRGISRIYIEKISLPDVKENGEIEITIEAIEFHPRSRARNVSHRAAAPAPDLAAPRSAFTGLEAPPAGARAPSTTPAIDP